MIVKKIFDIELVSSDEKLHVYGDQSGAVVLIPSVYMRKSGLPSNPPQRITVTLDYEVEKS